MANDNVLDGVKCPGCGSEGPFNVYGNAMFLDVTDDGVADFMDFQWEDNSTFICLECKHRGKAKDFGG